MIEFGNSSHVGLRRELNEDTYYSDSELGLWLVADGMPHLLAHGFQTLIHTAPGAGLFPFLVEESLVGFLEQSSRFLKPVYADDTIYPALEVTELTPGRTTGVVTLGSTVHNQRRELVLEGKQKFLVRRRPT